jgi:hypothetical protein
MPYTLDTDFDEGGRRPPQYAGVFRPTDYGRAVFPRLSGILTAASGLKDQLEARGLSEDDIAGNEVADLLDTTPEGGKSWTSGKR